MGVREAVARYATWLWTGLPVFFKIQLDDRSVKALEAQAAAQQTLAKQSTQQTALLTAILAKLRQIVGPRSARNLRVRFVKEKKESDMDMIVFALTADPPTDLDVAKRELTLTLNPGTADEKVLTVIHGDKTRVDFATDDSGAETAAPQDAFVKASLVDIDDAGNPADPDEITFQLLDTFAPTSASGLGVRFVREFVAPDPTPPSP